MTNNKKITITAHVLSDIHLEHNNANGIEDFFQQLQAQVVGDNPDLAILAGDITEVDTKDGGLGQFTRFTDMYKTVIYVPGNHEYYDSSITRVHLALKELEAKLPNLKVLRPGSTVTLHGQRFVGDTMWYPKPTHVDPNTFSDFAYIHRPTGVYLLNADFVKYVIPTIQKDDVVVTHHMPFPESIHPKFAKFPYADYNHFFMFDCNKYINASNAPKLWIHGHTHFACDYTTTLGTRVYCNPKGYPREGANQDFWNHLLVKI